MSYQNKQQALHKKEVYELLNAAKILFEEKLRENPHVSSYLEARQLDDEIVTYFSVGFSPKQLGLKAFLISKGFSTDAIDQSGLFSINNNSSYERFSDRVVFPIHDYQNRVVGFGGRIVEDNKNIAKYVNSEESRIFEKRKLLYGLYKAKKEINKKGFILIMEGYIDVVMAHKYNFHNAVACMGTALTEEQIKTIKRFVNKVYLVMDSDTAGVRSTLKSYALLKQFDCNVFVVELSQKDPADFLSQEGALAFQDRITNAKSGFTFYFDQLLTENPIGSIEDVASVVDKALITLKQEKDPLIQHHYIEMMATKLNVDPNLIIAKFKRTSYNNASYPSVIKTQHKNKFEKAEELIIALISSDLELRQASKEQIKSDDFISKDWKYMFDLIQKTTECDNEIMMKIDELRLRDMFAKLLLEKNDLIANRNKKDVLIDSINVLHKYHAEKKREEIKKQIKELEKKGGGSELEALLGEL